MKFHTKLFATVAVFIATLGFAQSALATAYTLDDNSTITDGIIRAMVQSGNDLYIGGDFTYIGPRTGMGVVTDQVTGAVNTTLSPKVNGAVWSAISDGYGGWYIGGDFTSVGGVTRNRIAHILSTGVVDPNFNPNATSGSVRVLALSTTTSDLYVGGSFTTVGGLPRNRIAKLKTSDGTADATFNPGSDDVVYSFALSTTTSDIYVGGQFTTIGGALRASIAKLRDRKTNCVRC